MSKTVLITGATSGIGKATALKFDQMGWNVAIVARNPEKTEDLKSQLKNKSYTFQCDLSDPDQVKVLTDALKNYNFDKPLTALVNNAGIISRKSFNEHTSLDWQKQFQVNLFSPVAITQSCFEHLKNSSPSTVINVSSTLGIRAIENCAAYSSSKAAMNSWTHTLAIEWAKYNITVNAMCIGIVDTPIHQFENEEQAEAIKTQMHKAHPIGRMAQPEEIADNIFFMTSPASQWTTGTLKVLDGGISL